MAIPYDPYTDENSARNPYSDGGYDKFDAYSFEKSKKGIALEKQRKKAEEEALKNASKAAYSEWKPMGYSQAPTALGRMNDEYMDWATDNVLNIYAKSGTGNDLDSASTFVMDTIMATALNKEVWEVARRHDYYASMFTGSKMESKDAIKAFTDSWKTDKLNRKVAGYMNRFDKTDDEEERAELIRKMEKTETEILKRGDYSDRGIAGNMLISSAPIARQVVKAIGITAAGFGAGYLFSAASILASSGNATRAVGMALKAARYTKAASIGQKAGAAVNMLDTYLTESGSFSRELYNMVDANGNRVSDETRNIAKFVYGAIATAIEYATLEPAMDKFIKAKGGAKVAKAPFMKFVRGHYMTNYLWTSITGGIGESVEELLQAGTSSVAQDVAKIYSNETGKTSFGNLSAAEVLERAWNAGEDAFLEALGPSIIAGTIPNIPASIKDTRINKRASRNMGSDANSGMVNPMKWKNQFDNMDSYVGDGKDASELRKSAEKNQTASAGSTIMDMDKIRVKSEKPSKDYGAASADGKAAEKLGPIDVMPDPEVNGQWVGVTEADRDKLKWLFNKGVEGVAVNVVSGAGITEIDGDSMRNLASQHNGTFNGDTIVLGRSEDLESMRKELEGFGIRVEGDNSFRIRTGEDSGERTIRLSTTDPDSDIYELKKQIREASPNLTDEEASIAARLTSIADAGTGTIQYEKSYKANSKKKDFRGATDAAKSLIYVGKKSDPSTFAHELFHAVSAVRQGEARELSNTIRKAIADNDSKARLTAFIGDNIAIWGENANADSIVKTLGSIAENGDAASWSKKQNEALARLYEAYRGSKDSISSKLPEGIRKVLEKLSEYIRKVYGTLKSTNSLNDDIAAAYDKLMGFDSMQDEKSMAERQKSFNEFKQNAGGSNLMFQENQEQSTLNQQEIQREKEEFYETEKELRADQGNFDADGNHLAPNGKPSNLGYRQWVQVRTPSFKKWFGDWEKTSRIKKLLQSEKLTLIWNKESPAYNLDPASAKTFLQDKYQGETFENHDTGKKYVLGKKGRQKLLSHSRHNEAYLKSLFFLPEIIKNSTFILESNSYKENGKYDRYRYFVCGINLDGIDYTVKSVFGLDSNGKWVYDQSLSEIEKGTLIGMLNKHVTQDSLQSKDTTLLSILQDNSSKVVDENNEPKPVKHGTPNRDFDTFDSSRFGSETDAGWLGQGFYFYGNNETYASQYSGTDGRVIDAFLKVRNPYYISDSEVQNLADVNNIEASEDFARGLKEEGYDGVFFNGDLNEEWCVFEPNQIKSATDNNGDFSLASDSILYQDSLDNDKQKKPKNLLSVDALNGLSKRLSDYSSNDVQVLVENNIYVPTSILTRLSSSKSVNPAIADEIGIRKLISRFVTDSDKETASLSPNLRSFLEKMKAEKETAWNGEMEKMYTKYYIYSKVLTPTEMRSQFIEENQSMNQLLSLKEALTKRRVYYRDSKTGSMIGRLYVPKAGYVYDQISQLTKDSPEAVVNGIRESIRKDTDAWIKAYIRSTRDFEKINAVSTGDRKADEKKLGSERWLRATAEMGYLAFGDLDFAYAEKLRLASSEGGKELMSEAMKLNEASYSQDYVESARSSLPPELATLAERKDREIQKAILGEREKSASKIEKLKNEKKDAKQNAKADKKEAVREAVEWERFKRQYSEYEIKDRYESKIKELKQKEKDDIAALRKKQYDRIDAIKDDYQDKMKSQAERYRKWRKVSEQNIKAYYNDRIANLKAWYEERTKAEKAERNIKRGLNVNLSTYDYSLVEVTSYLYDLINDNERKSDYRIGDSDYERLRTRKGTVDESEGMVTFYEMVMDADGNMDIDDSSRIEIPMGEERFDRTAFPEGLAKYLSTRTMLELKDTSKPWASISLKSKENLAKALAFAREDAKARLAIRKEAQSRDRNAQARESVSDILKTDIDLSGDMLERIAKEMGEDWKAISRDAGAMAEFREKAERYFRKNNGLMPAREIGKLRETATKATQLYGQFQRYARLMGDNIYRNFVETPQKALDERQSNITRRNALGDEEFGKILSDGSGKDKKGNYRHDRAKLDWLNGSYEVGSSFGDGATTKLSGWNMVGAYMYSKNIHGFIKLISRTGNAIAIEEMARISPRSTLEFINEDLRQRHEFAIIEDGRRLKALAEQREYKPRTLNSILSGYDEARLMRIKGEIESSSKESILPSYATALGDKIIELMGKETERVERTAYSLYNAPFKLQSNYVPLYGRDSAHRDSAISGVKGKGDRVYKGMIADRTLTDSYALMLEPVTAYRNAIREQETFINMTKAVNDLNWLMSENGGNLHRLIANQYGKTMANIFERQIETLAFTRTPLLGYETIGNKLVSNASAAAVAFNLPSIVKNFVSEITSLAEGDFRGRDMMYAIRELSANRAYWEEKYRSLAPDIAESTFSFDYQMLKDSNSLDKYGKRKLQVLEAGLKGLEWADRKAKMIAWVSSFQNGIESGMSERDAAVKATLLVKRTQSVSNPDALSPVQRSENPWTRAMFAFTKDTFQIWNQLTFGIASDISKGENMKAFEKAVGALLTSAIMAALAGGWLPDKDDDEFDPKEFFRDWLAQLMEYVPVAGPGIKGGIDGWDSDLITIPNELGRLMSMPFNKKDYTWQEYAKQVFDLAGSGASAAGIPVNAINKAKKAVFKDGVTEGIGIDPGYLYSGAVGDWLYNADMLDLLDSLF